MDYDVVIIGAGMSGLAAGIRLAHYDKRVCIVERHSRTGGLNSYYSRGRTSFDVGLHAVTNYVGPEDKRAPLNKLLRQLRLSREEFALVKQQSSAIRFPDAELTFTNDFADLEASIAERFPDQIDGFRRLVAVIAQNDTLSLETAFQPTRPILEQHLTDPLLRDMLLCPLMYYGNAMEQDMDFNQFCILFQSIYQEGFCRPEGGVRQLLDLLEKRYRDCGGELLLNCGVRTIRTLNGTVAAVELDNGTTLHPGAVLSTAGYIESLNLCQPEPEIARTHPRGKISVVESIFVLDRPAADFGFEHTIVFFNRAGRFDYSRPDRLVDERSGVVCAPGNFQFTREPEPHTHRLRLTHLANHARWAALEPGRYREEKANLLESARNTLKTFAPGMSKHVVLTDVFTPCTIERFTGHIDGAVYGTPEKRRDGTTPVNRLYICGTDQGFLGIVGALLSGVSIANRYLLR